MPPAPSAAVPVQRLEVSPALQIIGKMKDTLEGRVIGVLITHGSDRTSIDAVKKGVGAAGAKVKFIAPKIGEVKLSDGSLLKIMANWLVRRRSCSMQLQSSFRMQGPQYWARKPLPLISCVTLSVI